MSRATAAVGIHAWVSETEPQAPNVIGGFDRLAALDADFFSAMDNDVLDPLGNPMVWRFVVGDEGRDVLGTNDPIALPAGAADVVWRYDDTHWMARRGFRMWASRDGGASWARVGLVPYLRRGRRGARHARRARRPRPRAATRPRPDPSI